MRFPLLILVLAALPLRAQSVPVGDPLEDYARLLQLTGELPAGAVSLRPFLRLDAAAVGSLTATHPWAEALRVRYPAPSASGGLRWRVLPLETGAGYNSARPWGVNDGARWQGRGGNVYASGGVELRWGRWSAALRPVAVRAENTSFALSPIAVPTGLSPWAYPTGSFVRIDAPQRFGSDAYQRVDLGESYIRGDFGPVAVGVSNETQWWGTGRRNSIMLTNNGPGFGHAWVGTSRPVKLPGVELEAKWTWGRLTESAFFDTVASNDLRYHTGAVLVARPAFIPGLELGVSRIFVQDWRAGGPSAADLALVLLPLEKTSFITPENPTGDDERDQMAALFARWVFPESGFEFYGEWARGDHGRDFRDALVEPEHASAFLVGFQKSFVTDSGAGRWRMAAELTLLGLGRPSTLRAPPTAFYAHHLVPQGYTQRGQVMGAGIGQGSSQLMLGLDRFTRWGKVGGGVLRTVYDNDRFYLEPRSHHTHEVEPSFYMDALWFRGAWDLSAQLVASRLLNKWYIERNDERNLHLGAQARWYPGRRTAP
jgi:hypothetical protein